MTIPSTRSKGLVAGAIIALVFGGLTIFAGGTALFGGAVLRAAYGDFVPFVLWFNFIAGFVYVLAGIGLYRARRWAAQLALGIAVATALVCVALAVHVASGGPFEMRTIGAMILRTVIWSGIALLACRTIGCRAPVLGR